MTERKDEAEPSSTIETDLKQKKKRIKQETNTHNQSKKVFITDNIYFLGRESGSHCNGEHSKQAGTADPQRN